MDLRPYSAALSTCRRRYSSFNRSIAPKKALDCGTAFLRDCARKKWLRSRDRFVLVLLIVLAELRKRERERAGRLKSLGLFALFSSWSPRRSQRRCGRVRGTWPGTCK